MAPIDIFGMVVVMGIGATLYIGTMAYVKRCERKEKQKQEPKHMC